MPPPRYVFIDPSLTGPEARPWQWLGKVTRLMDRPSENYAPFKADTAPFLSRFFLKPSEDIDSSILVNTTTDKGLQVKLLGLFRHDQSSSHGTTAQFESPRIVTFSLQQLDLAFDAMLNDQSARAEIDRLLVKSKGEAFFIVGVKLCYNAIVSFEATSQSAQDTIVTIPAVEAAAIALQIPLKSIPDGVNPQAGWNRGNTQNRGVTYAFRGPRLFAMEFRRVKVRKSIFHRRLQQPQIPDQIPRFRPGNEVFGRDGGEGSSKEELSDDPESPEGSSDIDEEQEAQAESSGILLSSSDIQVLDLNDGLGWATAIVGNGKDEVTLMHDITKKSSQG
jgi:hypothetical protein